MESSLLPDQSGSIPESGILTMGSLFAGIGGLEHGFESHPSKRFRTAWQVECNAYASRVLEKHWPTVLRHDDVCTWPTPNTPPIDVLLAGFPCQDISFNGKGAGLDGKRSGLFWETMRIVREMGPRWIVLENVPALLAPGRGMERVLGSLASLRYDAEWSTVSASEVGAPHKRNRLFIIAWKDDVMGNPPLFRVQGLRSFGEQVASSHDQKELPLRTGETISASDRPNGEAFTRLDRVVDGFSHWVHEPPIARVSSGVAKRADRIKCLGNAVVPQVAQVVAERLLEIHDERRMEDGN